MLTHPSILVVVVSTCDDRFYMGADDCIGIEEDTQH